MDFSLKAFDAKNPLKSAKTGCIVVAVFDNKKLSPAALGLDGSGAITAALNSGDITGKAGTTLLLRSLTEVQAERVLLVGLGSDESISEKSFASAVQAALKALTLLGANDAIIALPMTEVKERDVNWCIACVVQGAHESAYRSDTQKSQKEPAQQGVNKLMLAVAATVSTKAALAQSIAISNGMQLSKDLGNLSANICTPSYLASTAKKLAKDFQFEIEVLDRKQLQALKMGSFLSVSQGSDQPPKFIVLKHMGAKTKDAPVVLVGKGITFDTGGVSIKGAANMDEMKYDMCGAASVLGTFRAIGEMKLKLNVIGVIASCENMISGSATKPGDIVNSMNGLSIEVLNTDAEGRLVLCDALTYAERFNPALVIDIATLTGACVVALGHHNTGLFTRSDAAHDKLADDLLAAGKSAGDTAWRMPIEAAYNEQLKSNFADLANIGTPGGGAVTAAAFLENFTRKYTWAHLDIAGTAWKSGTAKGATGRPVPLLTHFLINKAGV